ncbi:MAG: hypothetical protein SOZ00_07665 [Tidjanibacter sp.]|nr:hypothetical protein [Tidjanibacter sp.]
MKRVLKYAAAVATVAMLWSCVNNEEKIQQRITEFCGQTEMGIYNGNSKIYAFEPETQQVAFAASEKTCRLQADDLSLFVQYALTGNVTENGTVKVTITSLGVDNVAVKNIDMTVKKIDGNKLYLWQSDKQYGHLIYWEF